ncbi:FMN-binding negative transcriptional regulator [Flavobacterium sp. FlaQc-28]|uniref:FMN-binding negative transcriptional regulator n=1 Tax=Flavobacterium sp. FlaQc-28 TaxID=3374178 RepID=UPI003756EF43
MKFPLGTISQFTPYGKGKLITEIDEIFEVLEVLEATTDNYEVSYKQQWESFPEEYSLKMIKGIVAFEIIVTDLQAKKKLIQNKTIVEKNIKKL